MLIAVKHRTPDQPTPDHKMFGPTISRIFAKSYKQYRVWFKFRTNKLPTFWSKQWFQDGPEFEVSLYFSRNFNPLFRCDTPIKGIQPVPKIYVCAHEGTRHSLNGCRKSYLNFVGLDQHQKLRYNLRPCCELVSWVRADSRPTVDLLVKLWCGFHWLLHLFELYWRPRRFSVKLFARRMG
jgi:hypothetical protein